MVEDIITCPSSEFISHGRECLYRTQRKREREFIRNCRESEFLRNGREQSEWVQTL